MQLEKYVGQSIVMIYQDRSGKVSIRDITVHKVKDGIVKAFCMASQAPRTFKLTNILAVLPVQQKAG